MPKYQIKASIEEQYDQRNDVIKMQKLLRGFLARRRARKLKVLTYRQNYQDQFSTMKKLYRFKMEQYGAVLIIQRWFRSWRLRNKRKWQFKYRKMIVKFREQKKFYLCVKKSIILSNEFTQKDLDDREICKVAAVWVINRLVRGFLGRRRFWRLYKSVKDHESRILLATIRLQAFSRRCIAICRYPTLAFRYRVYLRKQREFTKKGVIDDIAIDDQGHRRRPSNLFLYIKFGTLDHIDEMELVSVRIQCCIRKFIARCKFQRLKLTLFEREVRRIQRWWKSRGWTSKLKRVLMTIQPLWKNKAKLMIQRRKAATKIQTAYRVYRDKRWLMLTLTVRHKSSIKIAKFLRYRRCLRSIRLQIRKLRHRADWKKAQHTLYAATYNKWLCHYTWLGAKKTRNIDTQQHELQRVFSAHSLGNALDLSKILKLFKDCKDLIDNRVTLNAIELQFTKLKPASEKRMDYETFLDLLANLAVIKLLNIDPTKALWEVGPSRPSSRGNGASAASADGSHANRPNSKQGAKGKDKQRPKSAFNERVLVDYKYGGFVGKTAFICQFINIYFSTIPDFKRAVESLGSKAALSQTSALLSRSIAKLQTFIKNRQYVKKLTKWLATRKATKVLMIQINAANEIIAIVRGFLARSRTTKMAQKLYCKYVDGETESDYWSNPKTGVAFWQKPFLLRALDCGMAIRMPPQDEILSVLCSVCERVNATCFCEQCNEPYCTLCFATGHRAGQRQQHIHVLIDNCVQCDFQLGTRYCNSCQDLFCDSCFKFVHKRGRLRFHAFLRYCPVCDNCEDRSAQWTEVKMDGKMTNLHWCPRCYRQEYGEDPVPREATYSESSIDKLRFYGKTVETFLETLRKEKRQRDIDESFSRRQAHLAQVHRMKCILTIQRVWRGFESRKARKLFLAKRKEMLEIRKKEDAIRSSFFYKFRSFLGAPPALLSDTPLEKVKKLYPWYLHKIIAECIENKWSDACDLLRAHDEHLASVRKASIVEKLSSKFGLRRAQKRFGRAVEKVKQTNAMAIAAQDNYYNAEASGAFPESKLRKIKKSMTKIEKQLQKLKQLQEKCEQRLEKAELRVKDAVGPRGLQKLIATGREQGVPLPFRVSIRHNSRLALVEWMVSTEDLDIDKGAAEIDGELPPQLRPGAWKSRLKVGDKIFINGMKFTVSPQRSARKKNLSGKSKKNKKAKLSASSSKKIKKSGESGKDSSGGGSGRAGEEGDGDGADASDSAGVSAKAGKSSKTGGDGEGSGDGVSGKSSSQGSEMEAPNKMEVELQEPCTENHITLDRPWLLVDMQGLEARKAVPHVFYMRPIRYLQRVTITSYPVQKIFQILAINSYKIARLCDSLSTFFDDDTDTHAKLLKISVASMQNREYWLKRCTTITQMSYDFEIRRIFGTLFYSVWMTIKSIAKMVANVYSVAMNAATPEAPYEYWQRSLEKEEVKCVIELNAETEEALGIIKIDLKAPCEVMREYMYRNFRDQLNATVGESFLFMKIDPENPDAEKELLPREDEFATYSKDFIVMKSDARTYESMLTVTLIRDKERGRVTIPEQKATRAKDDDDEEEEEEADNDDAGIDLEDLM